MRLPVYNKGLAALLVLTLKGIYSFYSMLRIHNIFFPKLPQRRPSLKRCVLCHHKTGKLDNLHIKFMKKFLFLFFFLSSNFIAHAQTYDTIRVTLTQPEFEKLKSDFLKISKTKLFLKSEKARENYFRKLPISCRSAENEAQFKRCLYTKLGDKRAKEVMNLGRKSSQLDNRLTKKFPKFYALLKKASIEQRIELNKL